MSEKKLPDLQSVQEFLFEAPLYEKYSVSAEMLDLFYEDHFTEDQPVDGHCPSCHKTSTFKVDRIRLSATRQHIPIKDRVSPNETLGITCARSPVHHIQYHFRKEGLTIEKIGQYPSLADIANDEVAKFRKTMSPSDAHEFHKAIGLAAHGVGIGSFVYLRRVFERLITTRFEAFKKVEKWTDKEFYSVRMEDKVKLLNGHLPEYLSENWRIYSILSQGLHELDEKTCLHWFGIMKQSIVIILEDDRKKMEDLQRRQEFTDAIADFGNKSN